VTVGRARRLWGSEARRDTTVTGGIAVAVHSIECPPRGVSARRQRKVAIGRMVEEAVCCEPVSGAQIPDNRENTGIWPTLPRFRDLDASTCAGFSRTGSRIPSVSDQGMFSAEQGIWPHQHGTLRDAWRSDFN